MDAVELQRREREIREQRARVYAGMSEIMDNFASRALTVDERKAFDDREAELKTLDADLDRVMAFRSREKGRDETAETRGVTRDEMDTDEKRYERAFSNFLKRGMEGLEGDEKRMVVEHRAVLDANALQTAPNAQGGYTIPQGFWHNLQQALKAYGGLLSKANVMHTATGNPLPWPTNDSTAVVGSYITEANQLGFTDFTFGQGLLNAWTITSGVVLASLQLVNDSAFDVDSFVTDRIGEAIGRKIAQELHTGSGSSALLGISTAMTARGILSGAQGGLYQPSATQTVHTLGGDVTSNAATAQPSFVDLQNMISKVDPAYRAAGACGFVMDDNTLTKIRNITDSLGHPLWQPSVQVGAPDQILGYPVLIDQNAGDISTSINTTGGLLFGDFKRAMVVRQVDQADVMRLTERYADYLQVGYLGFVRMDARSNDLRAAVVWKSASA